MTLPGLLIEYLINGVLSLVWIFPLFIRVDISQRPSWYLLLVISGLYFVGMIIDYLAWFITRPIKIIIRRQVEKNYQIKRQYKPGASYIRHAKFAIYAPEIARESAMRSSRDRIARGAIVNSFLSILSYSILGYNLLFVLTLGFIAILVSLVIWISFEKMSYGYELKAEEVLDSKIKDEKRK